MVGGLHVTLVQNSCRNGASKQQKVLMLLQRFPKPLMKKNRKYCDVTLLSMTYAGTGNVLKVQKLLGYCDAHLEKGETHQGPTVLGIALVSMAEELGLYMAIRSLEHLLQYGEQNIRRAVHLALGILCISYPKENVMNTLRRPSHDADEDVSMAAIISLGFIGYGTNNARIASMLLNLSSYYYKEPDHLFCSRSAVLRSSSKELKLLEEFEYTAHSSLVHSLDIPVAKFHFEPSPMQILVTEVPNMEKGPLNMESRSHVPSVKMLVQYQSSSLMNLQTLYHTRSRYYCT